MNAILERGKAAEDLYFREQDAKLLAALKVRPTEENPLAQLSGPRAPGATGVPASAANKSIEAGQE